MNTNTDIAILTRNPSKAPNIRFGQSCTTSADAAPTAREAFRAEPKAPKTCCRHWSEAPWGGPALAPSSSIAK